VERPPPKKEKKVEEPKIEVKPPPLNTPRGGKVETPPQNVVIIEGTKVKASGSF
jgi:hypothetical protein